MEKSKQNIKKALKTLDSISTLIKKIDNQTEFEIRDSLVVFNICVLIGSETSSYGLTTDEIQEVIEIFDIDKFKRLQFIDELLNTKIKKYVIENDMLINNDGILNEMLEMILNIKNKSIFDFCDLIIVLGANSVYNCRELKKIEDPEIFIDEMSEGEDFIYNKIKINAIEILPIIINYLDNKVETQEE